MIDAAAFRAGDHPRDITLVYAQLQAMRILPGEAGDEFIDTIVRETGWSRDFSRRAYGEYLRFVALTSAVATMCVPPRNVDRVWHLHLIHTRHYWQGMCETILGRPLHHEPASSQPDAIDSHEAAYIATLTAYEAAFKVPAPTDIWPRPDQPARRRGLDQRDRSAVLAASPVASLVVIGLMVAALIWGGGNFEQIFVLFVLALLTAGLVDQFRKERRREKNADGSSGCGTSSDDGHGAGDGTSSSSCGSSCGGGCGGD